MMKPYQLLLLAATLLFATTACNEDDDTLEGQREVEVYNRVAFDSDQAADIAEGEVALVGYAKADDVTAKNCVNRATSVRSTVVQNGVTYRRIRINFNGQACTVDGRTRSGSIVIQWVITPGADSILATKTVWTENYVVNGNQVRFRKTITYTTPGGALTKSVATTDTIVNTQGQTARWASTRVWTWTQGQSTPLNPADDRFSVTGSGEGTTFAGGNYSVNIPATSPLVWNRSCQVPQFTSGRLILTLPNSRTITLDYGTGDCDRTLTITYPNGSTRTVNVGG